MVRQALYPDRRRVLLAAVPDRLLRSPEPSVKDIDVALGQLDTFSRVSCGACVIGLSMSSWLIEIQSTDQLENVRNVQ